MLWSLIHGQLPCKFLSGTVQQRGQRPEKQPPIAVARAKSADCAVLATWSACDVKQWAIVMQALEGRVSTRGVSTCTGGANTGGVDAGGSAGLAGEGTGGAAAGASGASPGGGAALFWYANNEL